MQPQPEAMKPILEEYENIASSNPAAVFVPYRLMARIHRHQGERELARIVLTRAMEVAQSQPEAFKSTIKKIERDLKRLESD